MFFDDLINAEDKERGSSTALPTSSFLALNRRQFITRASAFTLTVALASKATFAQDTAKGLTDLKGGDATPSLWIAFTDDGKIEITNHRSEMGQQVVTSIAQIIADEMEAAWDDVEIVQALGHPKYGSQNTDGSTSIRRNLYRLRVAGAAMRSMLEQAAAEKWGVSVDQVTSAQSEVKLKGSGKKLSYFELAEAVSKQAVPNEDQVKLKDPKEWRYIGKGIPSRTIPLITRGEGTFGQDVRVPGMAYAVVAHPPQILGKVASYDDSETLKVPGVIGTVKMPDATSPVLFNPLGGVAVIAKDTWSAIQGRNALKVKWDKGPNAGYDSKAYRKQMEITAKQKGDTRLKRGDVYAALDSADKTISADYYTPHLSQAPMEPPSATARWTEDGKVECWVCIQTPQRAREVVAGAVGLQPDDVTVNVTWLGGAFGRKSNPDFAAEAAFISREMKRPIKVVWTREDDLGFGFTHSVSAQHFEGGLDKNGKCTAFLHRSVFPPIGSSFTAGEDNPSGFELGLGATDNPFMVPNFSVESGRAKAHVRIGWLRSVANVYHAFGVQSFANELAHAAGKDPKDYLLELIGQARQYNPADDNAEAPNYGDPIEDYPNDSGRLIHVIEKAAEMAKWGRKLPKGRGLGIAGHMSFQSYVATVIEVEVADDGALSIEGVWSAIDAGTVVNTKNVESQLQGGTIYGLSNALYGEISAKGGAVEQQNFPSWRAMRMSEAPRFIETHVVKSNELPGGVGEPPTPPAAPALANAIFAATGKRFRSMPFMGPFENKLPLGQSQDA